MLSSLLSAKIPSAFLGTKPVRSDAKHSIPFGDSVPVLAPRGGVAPRSIAEM